jgi:hypothetical protein
MASNGTIPTLALPGGAQPSSYVSDIIMRRDESKKWLRMNYWDEWGEVWRAIKCKTKPIYKTDSAGKETKEEDKSRTNVAMPDINLIYRRNVARLSAQPYTLRVAGGEDPTVGPRLSALLSQQYDRSNERVQDVRVRMAAESLGIGISKLYWDQVNREMVFRKAIMKGGQVIMRDRQSMMQHEGADPQEIQQAVQGLGPDMDDDEVARFMQKNGTEIQVPTNVPKYEGPCVKHCFPGDVYWKPFAKTLHDSDYIIESYRESDLWLKKMAKLSYKDQETGKDVLAFDPKALADLERADPEPLTQKGEFQELRDLFHAVEGKQDQLQYQFPRSLRVRKLYDILEEHVQDSDGRMWITWVCENFRDKPLGRMPYPWDLYGHTCYTEEVPLPDLIDAIGDSTPRLLRYLYAMHNLTVAQNFDYITNLIRQILLVKTGVTFGTEVIERGLMRIIEISDMAGWKFMEQPQLPSGALEREAQILQMMSLAEPAMGNGGGDSPTNPLAGKTATQSVLAAKSSDSLLQFKMDGRNLYLWELGMKKLWMNQQAAQDEWQVQAKFFGQSLNPLVNPSDEERNNGWQKPEWAISDRFGKTTAIKLDPMEIQEDLEVEPEAGSYMAVDDDMKKQAAMELDQIALQAPQVLNLPKVIQFHLSTIRGLPGDPQDFINPPAPPQPPQPKVNINFTGKLEDFPDVAKGVLQEMGVPIPEDLYEQSQLNTIKRLSDASDAADNLLSPSTATQHEQSRTDAANESVLKQAQKAKE